MSALLSMAENEKMIDKIKILVFVPQYLPGYNAGGPIRSVSNMVQFLGDEFLFKIITSDRDLYSDEAYPNISQNKWINKFNSEILYTSPGYLSIRTIFRILKDMDYDILYFNSYFHFVYSILPLFIFKIAIRNKKPVILAPRGEFSAGALQLKKIKKRIYILLSKFSRIYKNIYWQATSEFEKQDIVNIFNQKYKIFIAPNIPLKIKTEHLTSLSKKKQGILNMVFLSRISPKKNIDGALKILKGMKGKLKLDIYGPIEDGVYWKRCLTIIDELESNIEVSYKGSVNHDQVSDVLKSYDLFLFPTHGENFGHVIVEALSSGLPVIISDQTPWQNISKYHAGFDIPIDEVRKYQQILNKFVQMTAKEYDIFRKGALNYASDYFKNSDTMDQNRRLFINTFNSSEPVD